MDQNRERGNSTNFKQVVKKYFRKEDAFLVPNLLCYLRIILVVVFMVLYLTPITIAGNDMAGIYLAAAAMSMAAYSDFIDGYIARTFDQKSNLGKVLDPIADIFLQLGIVVVLLIKFHYFASIWMMFSVFALKEFTLFWEDLFLARRNRSYGEAKWYGKLSSFSFYCITAFLLLGGPFIVDIFPVIGEKATADSIYVAHMIVDICCSVASFFLALAWLLYLVLFVKLMKHGKDEVEVPMETSEKETKTHD